MACSCRWCFALEFKPSKIISEGITGAGTELGFGVAGRLLKSSVPAFKKALYSGAVRKILEATSSYTKPVIDAAFEGKVKFGTSLVDVVKSASAGLKQFDRKIKEAFSLELKNIIKEPPFTGINPESEVFMLPHPLAEQRSFSEPLIRKVIVFLRSRNIGVNRGQLIFKRPILPSSEVIDNTEKKALQEAFDEVLKFQRNASVKNVNQGVKIIGNLSKFDAGASKFSTGIIGELYHEVASSIKTIYPKLDAIRTKYATQLDVIDLMRGILPRNAKPTPRQLDLASQALKRLFNLESVAQREGAKQFAKETGVDVLGPTAGRIIETGGKELSTTARGVAQGARGVFNKLLQTIPDKILIFIAKQSNRQIAEDMLSKALGIVGKATPAGKILVNSILDLIYSPQK